MPPDDPNPIDGSEPGGSQDRPPDNNPPQSSPRIAPVSGKDCPACEEGTCEKHRPVTRDDLREFEGRIRKRVAKTVNRFRKSVKRPPPAPAPAPAPEPEPPKRRVGALGYMGNELHRMFKKGDK